MRNWNPYANTNWEKCYKIRTANHVHAHVTDPSAFREAMDRGYDLLTLSNYYPSHPYYPRASIKKNSFALSQENGLRYKDHFEEGPLNWNEIIKEWEEELGEKERANFPFVEGENAFPELPEGMLEAPNAEHHSFVDCDLIMGRGFHITAPGSLWASGNFDLGNKYHLRDHGYGIGAGLPWREGFKRILDNLLWEDGGGIIINHPNYTMIPMDFLLEALDYDDRVMGIEVWNSSQASEEVWDTVLRTGRQCFGFFAPDHYNEWSSLYNPMNILLPGERTAHACMKAYRNGEFYGCLFNSGLAFEKITFENDSLYIKTNKKAYIQVLGAPGVLANHRGDELEYKIKAPKARIIYLRVKVTDETMESIYSQPIMLP